MKPSSERPKFPEIWLALAHMLSERSTCDRAKVGAVITTPDNEQVLAIGYNGNYKGGSHRCKSHEQGQCGCLHAEVNALVKVVTKQKDKIVYATHSPCLLCAKLLINSGISAYHHIWNYRDANPKTLLQSVGITIKQWPEPIYLSM